MSTSPAQAAAGVERTALYLRASVGIRDVKRSALPYEGTVWCPRTRYGTWVARWNDRISITGNTARERQGLEKYPWDFYISDESAAGKNLHLETAQADFILRASTAAKKALFMSATPYHNVLEMQYLDKLGLWRDSGFQSWASQFGTILDPDTGTWTVAHNPRKLVKLREQLVERGQYINLDRNMDGYTASFGVVRLTPEQKQKVSDIEEAFNLAATYYESRGKRRMVMAARGNAVQFMKNYLERIRLPEAIELGKKAEKLGWKVIYMTEQKREVSELFDFLREPDDALGGRINELLPKLPAVEDSLRQAFGNNLANFSGPHSAMREGEKEAFLKDEKKHIYASYAAGGQGVDMHDADFPHLDVWGGDKPRLPIYIGLPWSGMMLDQAIGRPWRYGTLSDVDAIFLLSDAAPEMRLVNEKVAPRLESLRALVSGIKAGDPTVESLRTVDGALDYAELGNQDAPEAAEFKRVLDSRGVSAWNEIKMRDAKEATGDGKGMKFPGGLKPEKPPEAEILFQEDKNRPPQPLEKLTDQLKNGLTGTTMAPPPGQRVSPLDEYVRNLLANPQAKASLNASLPLLDDRQKLANWNNAAAVGDVLSNGGDPAVKTLSTWSRMMDWVSGLPPMEAAHFFNMYALTNGREIIRRVGGEQGRSIANDIAEYHVRTGLVAGPWIQELGRIYRENKLTPDSFAYAKFVIEGRSENWILSHIAISNGWIKDAKTMTAPELDAAYDKARGVYARMMQGADAARAAVPQLQALYRKVAERARRSGVEVEYFNEAGERQYSPFPLPDPSYVEHSYPREVYDRQTEQHNAMIQRVMNDMKVDLAEAERIVAKMKGRDAPLAANIEKAREGDQPGYRTDIGTTARYLEKAAEAVARTEIFGQRRQKLSGKITLIPQKEDRAVVSEIMDSLLTKQPLSDAARSWLGFTADVTVLTKMWFSAIPNMSQGINASLRTNMRDTILGLKDVLSSPREAIAAVKESGATLEQIHADMMREFGINRPFTQKFLELTGFMEADTFSRAWAQATATRYMERALEGLRKNPQDEFLRRNLTEHFSLSADAIDKAIESGGWQREDIMRGGKRLSDDTQFTGDPTELPPWWRVRTAKGPSAQGMGALVQTSMLLKSYAFKQGVLLKDALITEARKGNFRPWVPFMLLFPLVGEVVGDLSGLLHGNTRRLRDIPDDLQDPWKMLERLAGNIGYVGGLGLATTLVDTFRWRLDAKEQLLGPFYSDVLRTYQLIVDSLSDHKTSAQKQDEFNQWLRRTFPVTRVLVPTKYEEMPEWRQQQQDRQRELRRQFEGLKIEPPPVQ